MNNPNAIIRNLKNFFLSITASYIITIVGALILAFILLQFQVSEEVLDIGIIVIYVLSALVGGFLLGKAMGQRKFLWGFFLGIGYYAVLLVISVVTHRQIDTGLQQSLTCFFLCAGGGMLGGMAA